MSSRVRRSLVLTTLLALLLVVSGAAKDPPRGRHARHQGLRYRCRRDHDRNSELMN
jgi:hypothetical protein